MQDHSKTESKYKSGMKSILLLLIVLCISISNSQSQNLSLNSKDSIAGEPKYKLWIGGRLKLNGIYDFVGIPNTSALNPAQIPTGIYVRDPIFTMDMYQSRLKLGSTLKITDKFDIDAHVEADFFGNGGGGFRLRHAYVNFGDRFIVGQWWTTATDIDSWPQVTDFDGPSTGVWVRAPQIRFMHNLSQKWNFAVAIETPRPDFSRLSEVDTLIVENLNQNIPDLVFHFKRTAEISHLQIAGIMRFIKYTFQEENYRNLGYGAVISGHVMVKRKDKFLFQALIGQGIASYLVSFGGQGFDILPVPINGKLETLPVQGGYLSYQHFWNSEFNSTILLGGALIHNKFLENFGDVFKGTQSSINLYWESKFNFNAAIEFLYATHEDIYRDWGDASRIQFVVEYTF